MENPTFVNNENIPQITHHDEDHDYDKDYDDYDTPNTSKVDETTFLTPSSTDKQETSTL